MENSLHIINTTRKHQLPPHAQHPNPSMLIQRGPYIAYPQG